MRTPNPYPFIGTLIIVFCLLLTILSSAQNTKEYYHNNWADTSLESHERLTSLSQYIYYYYLAKAKYDSTIVLSETMVSFAKECSDSFYIAEGFKLKAYAEMQKGNNIKAIELLSLSRRIFYEIKERKAESDVFEILGSLYSNIGDFKKAKECFLGIIEYRKSANLHVDYWTFANLGEVYFKQKNFKKALTHFRTSIKVFGEHNYTSVNLPSVLNNSGWAHLELGQRDSALYFFNEGIEKAHELNASNTLSQTFTGIGLIYQKNKEFKESILLCEKALNLALQVNEIHSQKVACKCLYNGYKLLGVSNKALEYYELLTSINDSLNRIESANTLHIFELERQQQIDSLRAVEDALINEQKLAKEVLLVKRTNRIQYSLTIIAVFILATAIAIVARFKISPRLASGLIFIFFILTFECLLVVLDPWVDSVSNGEVGWKIGINTAIALVLFGVHQASEKRLKNALLKAEQ